MRLLKRARAWLVRGKSVVPDQQERSTFHWPLQSGSPPPPFVPREGQSSIAAFVTELHTLEAILARQEEEFWHGKIREARLYAEASDAIGVRKFLELCGGMGSLSDLVLPEASDAQERLNAARSRAFDLAHHLQRELNATPRA